MVHRIGRRLTLSTVANKVRVIKNCDRLPPMTETVTATKVVPLHDLVVIEPHRTPETTESGIVLPEIARHKSQHGTILAVGPGLVTEEGDFVPMVVQEGDEVVFPRWSGSEIDLDGEEVIIIHESDILGVIR